MRWNDREVDAGGLGLHPGVEGIAEGGTAVGRARSDTHVYDVERPRRVIDLELDVRPHQHLARRGGHDPYYGACVVGAHVRDRVVAVVRLMATKLVGGVRK